MPMHSIDLPDQSGNPTNIFLATKEGAAPMGAAMAPSMAPGMGSAGGWPQEEMPQPTAVHISGLPTGAAEHWLSHLTLP